MTLSDLIASVQLSAYFQVSRVPERALEPSPALDVSVPLLLPSVTARLRPDSASRNLAPASYFSLVRSRQTKRRNAQVQRLVSGRVDGTEGSEGVADSEAQRTSAQFVTPPGSAFLPESEAGSMSRKRSSSCAELEDLVKAQHFLRVRLRPCFSAV
jgi:hypothetical protein